MAVEVGRVDEVILNTKPTTQTGITERFSRRGAESERRHIPGTRKRGMKECAIPALPALGSTHDFRQDHQSDGTDPADDQIAATVDRRLLVALTVST